VETITKAAAKDLDLFVPSRQMTLRDMAYAYSGSWKRMANVEFRAGANGPFVSLLAVNGKIISDGAVSQWPMFAMGDMPRITYTTDKALAKSSKFAFSAGPLLIHNNSATNINTELSRGGFSGLDHASKRERAAIGIRRDNTIVHYANTAMTIKELQQAMLNQGCVNAMNLDGGGSVGVINNSYNLLIGYSVRQLCSALVFKNLLDDTKNPKVYISPGHGGSDPGSVRNGVTEKEFSLDVSKRVRDILTAHGVSVRMARETDINVDLGSRVTEANAWKADCFVSIHANSVEDSSPNGFEVFHSLTPGSRGKQLAEAIVRYLARYTPLRNRGAKTWESETDRGKDYHFEIRYTNMPAVIVEPGFVSNPIDAAYLKSDVGRRSISQAIACSTLEWLGVPAQHNEIAFADIVGHWAEAEIRKAYNLGLVKGRDDGLFHPGEPLTRAEAAIIACRLYDLLRR